MFMNVKTLHTGAIFAISILGKCLYTGGWDKKVNIQVQLLNLTLCFLQLCRCQVGLPCSFVYICQE